MSASLPKHIAIILDGNGRWAQAHQLPRIAGHKVGVDSVRKTIRFAAKKNIEVLTLFAFGQENWRRPAEEVSFLMNLFLKSLNREIKKLHKNNIKLRVIGDRSSFSNELLSCITLSEELTAQNTGLQLVIAFNYSGRWDITQACRRLTETILHGSKSSDAVTLEALAPYFMLADLPEPDLFIRTSGEIRLSNFLLWQLAYTELYFTDVLWPDFNEIEFEKALQVFSSRQRRFGYTGEQVDKKSC